MVKRFTIVKLDKIGKQNWRRRKMNRQRATRRKELFMARHPVYEDKVYFNFPDRYGNELLATLQVQLNRYEGMDILPNQISLQALPDDDLNAKLYHNPQSYIGTAPHASVLVAITNEQNPKILLTRRSSKLNHHAGEVSFVGGKRDISDRHCAHTALREAFEEVGLRFSYVNIVGYLPMQISKAGWFVRPVVAVIDPLVVDRLVPSEDEIERLFWLDLSTIIDTAPTPYTMQKELFGIIKNITTTAWFVDMDNDGNAEMVWGLTGRILANLVEIVYGVQHPWYYRVSDISPTS